LRGLVVVVVVARLLMHARFVWRGAQELETAGLQRNTNRERAAEAAEGHLEATGIDAAVAVLDNSNKGRAWQSVLLCPVACQEHQASLLCMCACAYVCVCARVCVCVHMCVRACA
jgi:hypothetical protein